MSESKFVLISPGNTPKFKITPTFSSNAFTPSAANAAIQSSDPVNFPVQLDPSDPTGLTFLANIPLTATPGNGEAITITWTYTNADGTQAVISGSVTEIAIVNALTGGTFAQIA